MASSGGRRRLGAPLYGQVVVGPPGVGKTTYCNGMQQYLRLLGRNAWVVNLDPANEYYLLQNQQPQPPDNDNDDDTGNQQQQQQQQHNHTSSSTAVSSYETILDVCTDLIQSSVVMEELSLGPNGSLLYCMEYLQQHVEDLLTLLEERIHENLEKQQQQQQQQQQQKKKLPYLLLDLPGQTEVYTHGGNSVSTLLQRLTKRFDLRLCTVQLLDATYCLDAHQFVSATVLGTTTMLRLEYSTVNVLSKVDLVVDGVNNDNEMDNNDNKALSNTTQLPFALDYFLECQDLERLVDYLHRGGGNVGNEDDEEEDDYYCSTDKEYQEACRRYRQSSRRKRQKYSKLYRLLAEVVHDFGLLHFLPLDIQNATSVGRVLAAVDKANGYVFVASLEEEDEEEMFRVALRQDETSLYQQLQDIAEQVHERQRRRQQQQT